MVRAEEVGPGPRDGVDDEKNEPITDGVFVDAGSWAWVVTVMPSMRASDGRESAIGKGWGWESQNSIENGVGGPVPLGSIGRVTVHLDALEWEQGL